MIDGEGRPVPRAASAARLRGHIAPLDGLRGAAALLVVLSHLPKVGLANTSMPQAGTFGVMIFFVLSGFLMGHLYLFKPFDAPSVFHYIVARISRVVPLFYAVIIGSFVLSKFFGPDFTYYLTASGVLKHLLFFGSDYVFWSIPPEVEFYFIFVLVWYFFFSRKIISNAPFVGILVAFLILAQPAFPGVTVFHKMHIFLVGIGCAALRNSLNMENISKRAALATQLVGLALIGLVVSQAISVSPTDTAFGWEQGRVYNSLPMALIFGAFIFSFTIETQFSIAVFGNRFARKLGAYSFSIYLLHEPVMVLARNMSVAAGIPDILQFPIALVCVIGVAAGSFHMFEMPMQTFVRKNSISCGRAVVAALRDRNLDRVWMHRRPIAASGKDHS